MIAVALTAGPVLCYLLWRFLRAAADDRTGCDRPRGAEPYSWGRDEELYRDLELRARELAR